MSSRKRIVVVGGGYAGLTAARRLLKRGRDLDVTLVNPSGYMTYQPLLPEVAAGTVQPGHVVVPLRSALPGARVLTAALTALDTDARVATATAADGTEHPLEYDELVLALGAVTRVFPVPGLVEHAIGFRTVEEALHLGNRVLARLELAASSASPEVRRRALTFVVVGGGYAGVEALAELQDMVSRAVRRFPGLTIEDTRWVLVEAAPRILGQLPERLATYATAHLIGRGVEVKTATTVAAVGPDLVTLGTGEVIPSDTVVWTAGVVANPLLRRLGLPCDPAGRVVTDASLRVVPGVWALGDCAAVPDLAAGGGVCPPTAQHAVRQAVRVADNIRGRLRDYRHRDVGAVASLGLRKGVAELYGVPLRGVLAWWVHRLYHGSRLPCPRRRLLVNLAWLLGSRGRDPVALHALESPRTPLQEAHAAQRAS
ncbi:NAD(P)/FAD-dependent oxidoreductase [Nocardioides antri]|uniref:NAD(P)/FAD-dependent oxidoreductase n=1 Tax=Nocardioides antri TaxID=2607659 RepID=A0A5B1M4W0_9ACTN|nr:NAD(P)/FAD-dependent oxidoreductase [Nocardioides antri]KAA1427706.1 NAD(P)/FAD-dependent oxidoreductase [Nocardioides antri]